MVGGVKGAQWSLGWVLEKWAKETEAEKFVVAIGQRGKWVSADKWNVSGKTVLTYHISKNLCLTITSCWWGREKTDLIYHQGSEKY